MCTLLKEILLSVDNNNFPTLQISEKLYYNKIVTVVRPLHKASFSAEGLVTERALVRFTTHSGKRGFM